MDWVQVAKFFFAGVFLTNAIPHLVHGISGKQFQSPFAKPPGLGFSSAIVNVLWAWTNILVGLYLGFYQANPFAAIDTVVPLLMGGFAVSVLLAWHFGRIYSKTE